MADTNSGKKLGAFGEEKAVSLLEKSGYKILSRNFHSRFGEIDIIASDDEYIVFAEVKSRSTYAVDRPAAWVGKRKQRKIIQTAYIFLEKNPVQLQPRFDVIEIEVDRRTGIVVNTEHIKNAFWAGD